MIKMKKNGQKVSVTFTFVPSEEVENVSISGEWNDWKKEPMKKKKNGEFYVRRSLKAGNTFEFGYVVNDEVWMTDSECPSVPSPFHTQNSLLAL